MPKLSILASSALRYSGAVAGVALLNAAIHFLISPFILLIDQSIFQTLRAPVAEEAFKYFVLWKIFGQDRKNSNLMIIGLAMGLSETLINFYVVYDAMMVDLQTSFPEFIGLELYFLLFIAGVVKFISTALAQTVILWLGLKISNGTLPAALLISIFLHWATNSLLMAGG